MASPSAAVPSSRPAYPPSPAYSDDLEFVTAYLTVHVLSDGSRVYAYILWIVFGAILLLGTLFHHLRLRGGYLGALWNKWALRRRTWRKKHTLALAKANGQPHRQPHSFPANAQIFTFIVIVILSMLASFLGPDYFAPGATLWTLHQYPYATTSTPLKKRAYEMSQFTQFMPQYTIPKAWWTSGNRTGLIAFALFPLCILFALKSPPFAILSLPFTVQFYCDKLLWLHKWTAQLIYVLTLMHVAFWSVQLSIERRDGKIAYTFAWVYEKFLFAWTSFGCMTLLFLLSIAPLRRSHYEAFWFLHVLLVPLTIIMAAVHHPPVWWWCWAALGLWIGERTWRFTWWLYTNGFLGGRAPAPSRKLRKAPSRRGKPGEGRPAVQKVDSGYPPLNTPSVNSAASIAHYPPSTSLPGGGLSVPTDYVPPPGFAHAELLPGHTVRLRIVTPGYLTWAPGQHFLIAIPSVTRFTTHPFTTASICDEQNGYDDGRVLVFLIRAKNGWTKDLWDTVAIMLSQGHQSHPQEALPRCEMPSRGVLLRALVDGPYGSSARASWGDYSSVLIVAGGSGVSYALSVLQYVCLCLAGRDGRFLGGKRGGYGQPRYKTTRVRFVWLVREFGHIQWCAPVLRRCMDIVSPAELQIDIFVTNVKPGLGLTPPQMSSSRISFAPYPGNRISFAPLPRKERDLEPPKPGFARPPSRSSLSSDESGEDGDVDLSYYTSNMNDYGTGDLGHEEHDLDLTNFDGDNDMNLPGEAQFNLSVKYEGRSRRHFSRRISSAFVVKQELLNRASQLELEGPSRSSVQLVTKPSSLPAIDTNLPLPTRPNANGSDNTSGFQHAGIDIGTARPPSTDGKSRPSSWQSVQFQKDNNSPQPSPSPLKTPNSAVALLDAMREQPPPLQTQNLSSTGRKRMSQLSALSGRSDGTVQTPGSQLRSMSRLSQWTDTDSFAALVPRGEVESVREQMRLDLDAQEVEDVSIVAEHARPGKPKLDRILADEVERAKGAVAVACCGPTSLDAMIRKIVAAQINPQRIRRGDMRGSIALFSEEFSY